MLLHEKMVPPGRKKIILSGGMSDGTVMERPFRKSKEPVFFCAKDAAKFHTKTL